MKKRELELAVRIAARIAREQDFYLIGSQAVHVASRRAPAEILVSRECDLYPVNRPEAAGLLDTALGSKSDFARKKGFYVDVVSPELASLPNGWGRRTKLLRVGSTRVHCLEIHDLIVSKLAAGRLKDLEFTGALLRLKLAKLSLIRQRIRLFPVERAIPALESRLRVVVDDFKS